MAEHTFCGVPAQSLGLGLEQEGSVRIEGWRYFLMCVLRQRWPVPIEYNRALR